MMGTVIAAIVLVGSVVFGGNAELYPAFNWCEGGRYGMEDRSTHLPEYISISKVSRNLEGPRSLEETPQLFLSNRAGGVLDRLRALPTAAEVAGKSSKFRKPAKEDLGSLSRVIRDECYSNIQRMGRSLTGVLDCKVDLRNLASFNANRIYTADVDVRANLPFTHLAGDGYRVSGGLGGLISFFPSASRIPDREAKADQPQSADKQLSQGEINSGLRSVSGSDLGLKIGLVAFFAILAIGAGMAFGAAATGLNLTHPAIRRPYARSGDKESGRCER